MEDVRGLHIGEARLPVDCASGQALPTSTNGAPKHVQLQPSEQL